MEPGHRRLISEAFWQYNTLLAFTLLHVQARDACPQYLKSEGPCPPDVTCYVHFFVIFRRNHWPFFGRSRFRASLLQTDE